MQNKNIVAASNVYLALSMMMITNESLDLDMWNFKSVCGFKCDNWWTTGSRHVKNGMKIDYKHTYKFHVIYCL